MTDPELPAPGETMAVGPVAAGPMAVPPPTCYYITIDGREFGWCVVTRLADGSCTYTRTDAFEEMERLYPQGRVTASTRARTLLTRLLTDAQRATFESDHYIDVTGKSGLTYRICCWGGGSGNIALLDRGHRVGSFCVAPGNYRLHLPDYDVFLGQLLLITCDETRFLRVAVYSGPLRALPRRHRAWAFVNRLAY